MQYSYRILLRERMTKEGRNGFVKYVGTVVWRGCKESLRAKKLIELAEERFVKMEHENDRKNHFHYVIELILDCKLISNSN